jgi:hypothetical protein
VRIGDRLIRWHGGCDMDYKLELVLIPVSDVDRAKNFYLEQAGFELSGARQLRVVRRIQRPGR